MKLIGNIWDSNTRNTINDNFKKINESQLNIIKDLLESDPKNLDLTLNGLNKQEADLNDFRNLDNFGTIITPKQSAVIYGGWVNARESGKVIFAIAEQELNSSSHIIIKEKEFQVTKGWNFIKLIFPVEARKNYNLYKKNVNNTMSFAQKLLDSYSGTEFLNGDLNIRAGKFLNSTNTARNYSPFFEISTITNLVQIYKLLNDSTVTGNPIYVGDNPPTTAQFWFKPVGDK